MIIKLQFLLQWLEFHSRQQHCKLDEACEVMVQYSFKGSGLLLLRLQAFYQPPLLSWLGFQDIQSQSVCLAISLTIRTRSQWPRVCDLWICHCRCYPDRGQRFPARQGEISNEFAIEKNETAALCRGHTVLHAPCFNATKKSEDRHKRPRWGKLSGAWHW